jgi:hypothetical protein
MDLYTLLAGIPAHKKFNNIALFLSRKIYRRRKRIKHKFKVQQQSHIERGIDRAVLSVPDVAIV